MGKPTFFKVFFALVLVILLHKGLVAQSTVRIGNQVWMVENLNVELFRNGDPIPYARSRSEWMEYANTGKPAWCYYEGNSENGSLYGKLYNWYAVNDPRGLAPYGWHVPTIAEWTFVVNYLGGLNSAGEELKSRYGWQRNGRGNNKSGWSGLPGGKRSTFGDFDFIETGGYWWTRSKYSKGKAWYCALRFEDGKVSKRNYDMGNGFSVRCVRD